MLGPLNFGGQPIGALLQRLVVHAQPQHVVHTRFELYQVVRLGEKVGGTQLQSLVPHVQLVIGRDHQDRRVDALNVLAKLLQKFQPVHAGHHVVQDDQIRCLV